jgi:hypothetical protein
MKIAFTGHRDRQANPSDLAMIAEKYPGSEWVHGGAKGFDTQVEQYARDNGIRTTVIRPDYVNHYVKLAPLVRDRQIVDKCDLLVALYDGRQTGGTLYTIGYAKPEGKDIVYLRPA